MPFLEGGMGLCHSDRCLSNLFLKTLQSWELNSPSEQSIPVHYCPYPSRGFHNA